jgi:hypothetical protein
MFWPVVALIGFLLLMALVIALGTRSTKLYERAQQVQTSATSPAAHRSVVAEPPDS